LKHVSQVRNGEPVLVSACLLGLNTRYDAASCECQCLRESLAGAWVIPVCPEQLGGLPTPRPPAEIASGDGCAVLEAGARVLAADGRDVTENYVRGAQITARIAELCRARRAFLKEDSPSCGVARIQRGGKAVQGMGVAAALLARRGVRLEGID